MVVALCSIVSVSVYNFVLPNCFHTNESKVASCNFYYKGGSKHMAFQERCTYGNSSKHSHLSIFKQWNCLIFVFMQRTLWLCSGQLKVEAGKDI